MMHRNATKMYSTTAPYRKLFVAVAHNHRTGLRVYTVTPPIMQKPRFSVIVVLTVLSCQHKNVSPTPDIYREWRWISTTLDTRGEPITAEKLDTAYFYSFQGNGILEQRDANKDVREQLKFEIVQGRPFNTIVIEELKATWGYAIYGDTLKIWDAASIFPRTNIFRVEQ